MRQLFSLLRSPRSMLAELENSDAFREHQRRLEDAAVLAASERAGEWRSIVATNNPAHESGHCA